MMISVTRNTSIQRLLLFTTTISIHSPITFQRNLSSKPPKTDEISEPKKRIRSLKKKESKLIDSAQELRHLSIQSFPKAPASVQNLSREELFAKVNHKPLEPTTTRVVDFQIPHKYMKSKAKKIENKKNQAILDEIDNFTSSSDKEFLEELSKRIDRLITESSLFEFRRTYPEHPLKRSITGLMPMNPEFDDIDDEFLWKLIPNNKLYGVPPYEPKLVPNGFKIWETKELEKLKVQKEKDLLNAKKYNDYIYQFNKQEKSHMKISGSRKKLDRKLLKQYRELQKEGIIPKNDKIDDDDDLL